MNTQICEPEICCVCSGQMHLLFRAVVLLRHDVAYFHCIDCGFLRAEYPYWLNEAYTSAIASTDIGLVARNKVMASRLAGSLYFALGVRRFDRTADMAGGYGMLVRLLRDYGFDCYWQDEHCENLFARSFEMDRLSPDVEFSAVSAVEVMEHLIDPVAFVRDVLARTGASAFIFTTQVYVGDPPAPHNWWYYSLETGQHISFFQTRTLESMACALNMHFYTYRGLHVFTRRPISQWVLRLASGRLHPFASYLARRRLGSRLPEDHAAAIARLVEGGARD